MKEHRRDSKARMKALRRANGMVEFRRWVSEEERVLLNKFCNAHGMIRGRTFAAHDKKVEALVRGILQLDSST